MLKPFRQQIVHNLWSIYCNASAQMKLIQQGLQQQGIEKIILDHFAIIDLPGPHTGIIPLSELFTTLGYTVRGRDYLQTKQNDFVWLAESDSEAQDAIDVLPQIVVADFRLDELPLEIKKIIEKYAKQACLLEISAIKKLIEKINHNDHQAKRLLMNTISLYLAGRDWPLPTKKEFSLVNEFNELLAWVLVFGRKPNHFTLSIHLLNHFSSLHDFHYFIESLPLKLNDDGGLIKGGIAQGIAQSSTMGTLAKIKLSDGTINLPTEFVEFVWRYPNDAAQTKPKRWQDFFTGFIAQHADHVIESLYGPVPYKDQIENVHKDDDDNFSK